MQDTFARILHSKTFKWKCRKIRNLQNYVAAALKLQPQNIHGHKPNSKTRHMSEIIVCSEKCFK